MIGSLAREGELDSVLWAGPEQLGGARRTGRVEGTTRTGRAALELGFASDDFGYLFDLGLPQMAGHNSLFALDPEIKREAVFVGLGQALAALRGPQHAGEEHVDPSHRNAVRPPRGSLEQVQRTNVGRGVDQKTVFPHPAENPVGDVFG